jgi:DNA-binding ferritin-like protein (Dps family)
MKAYELADKLKSYFHSDYDEIVTQLRQQANRIAELEKQLNFFKNASVNSLFTGKQLSDDDIEEIAENLVYDNYERLKNAFARAIIREINK